MAEENILKNYVTYKGGLDRLFGKEVADNIIEALGGEERVTYASYLNTAETGAAYAGSFIKNVIKLVNLANKINEQFPEEIRADKTSIGKVCMLSQIAKIVMFEPNDDKYEIEKRGIIYKYVDLKGALRAGERSTLIASNAGVKFTDVEYEAMRALDKSVTEDSYLKFYSSVLSVVIRQASEIINLTNRLTKSNGN